MRRKAPRLLHMTALLSAVCLLGACGRDADDQGPGGVTVAEADALDDAAAMLDSRQKPTAQPDPETASDNVQP